MLQAWRSEVARSRGELFDQIRRDHRVQRLSIREPADRHRVHLRTVRQAVAERGPACAASHIGAVPQTHAPRAGAEVDFGEFYTTRVWLKLWMFVMRLPHSGRAFHVAFADAGTGGIPARARAGVGALKTCSTRSSAARARTVHTKRAGQGIGPLPLSAPRPGLFSLSPAVASLAELNTLIAAGDLLDDTRVITGRLTTVATAFAAELPALLLPGEMFGRVIPSGGYNATRRVVMPGIARASIRSGKWPVQHNGTQHARKPEVRRGAVGCGAVGCGAVGCGAVGYDGDIGYGAAVGRNRIRRGHQKERGPSMYEMEGPRPVPLLTMPVAPATRLKTRPLHV